MFEFNELSLTPVFLRESIVEILGNGFRWGRVLEPAGPVFTEFCRRAGADRVLDLCSGTGEPVSMLVRGLVRHNQPVPRFHLSDLFPNVHAMQRVADQFPGKIEPVPEPVDATDVSPEVDCPARIIINAFHHFSPEVAAGILADAVNKRRAIFILEAFPRDPVRFGAALPFLVAGYLGNPLVAGQDRFKKMVFTYLLPLIGALGMWDAVVSCLRMHGEQELAGMAEQAGGESGYAWEYREVPFSPGGRCTVFFGIPE